MDRARLLISGRVQGVGYRASTHWAAKKIGGLTGWVRNLDDGRVEAVVEGPRDKIEELVAWAHQGPPAARVSDVEVAWEPATGEFKGFDVTD
ncbi:MAG TPA: acylphosphatase [Planctomycetota bacterium]